MKIVVYGSWRRVGALVGDQVIDLNRPFARYLHERRDATDPAAQADERTPYDFEGFISRGTAALDDAREALAHVQRNGATTQESQARESVKLYAPTVHPPTIACAGANYVMHPVGTQSALRGEQITAEDAYRQARAAGPWGFWKVIGDLRGDRDMVSHPARAKLFDYEGELAVVRARRGTGAGPAMDSSPRGADGYASTDRFLKPGDVVEVSSPAIGVLRNHIVAKGEAVQSETGRVAAGSAR